MLGHGSSSLSAVSILHLFATFFFSFFLNTATVTSSQLPPSLLSLLSIPSAGSPDAAGGRCQGGKASWLTQSHHFVDCTSSEPAVCMQSVCVCVKEGGKGK